MSDTEQKPTDDGFPEKLKLLKTPLVESEPVKDEYATGFQQSINPQAVQFLGYSRDAAAHPTLVRNSTAGNLETFYDLFLAALNIFNKNQQVDADDAFSPYIGFFSLLWSTWLVTGLYDVRFVTDSVFERCTRAIHFGVLMGFVTVSPNFDPAKQDARVFQTFSIILMISRLCLAVQYAAITWQLRSFKATRLPMLIMVGINFIAAAIYLGVSFRFQAGANSRVFSSWYALGGGEMILTIGLGMWFPILSFEGTHLVSRISLLTCIIFGEGVGMACGKVTDIIEVGSHVEWTSQTIGVVTAGVGTTYIVFMVYFDWMPTWSLGKWRQIIWALLHYPLQLTMTMFVEGCAEMILLWKCVENARLFDQIFDDEEMEDGQTDEDWLEQQVKVFLQRFNSTYTNSDHVIDYTIAETAPLSYDNPEDVEWIEYYMYYLSVALQNVIFHAYGIDFVDDVVEESGLEGQAVNMTVLFEFEHEHYVKVLSRFEIVFQYTFVCAGMFLLFSTLLYVAARRSKWTYWAGFRIFVNVCLAVGISTIAYFADTENLMMTEGESTFMKTPYVLPVLLCTFLVVLLVNHLLGDGPTFSFFKSMKQRRREQREKERQQGVAQPLAPLTVVTEQTPTHYDPGTSMAGQDPNPGNLPRFNSYSSQFDNLPSGRPYSQLNLAQQTPYAPAQYAPQAQQAQQAPYASYAPPSAAAYTTLYQYSGNEGPR